MKTNKGFIVPLLLGVIVLLVVGGGVYIYNNKKAEAPATVDTGTTPSITILSPVSGENWMKGTRHTIKWQDNGWRTDIGGTSCGAFGTPCVASNYQIYLSPNPQAADTESKLITRSARGPSYDWYTGDIIDNYTKNVATGSYLIQVCDIHICSTRIPIKITPFNDI